VETIHTQWLRDVAGRLILMAALDEGAIWPVPMSAL